MRIQCSGCEKALEVPDGLAGKKVKCPVCGRVILVPAAAPAEELRIEEVAGPEEAEKPAPPAQGRGSRRRLRRLSSRRAARARRELAELAKPPGPSAPPGAGGYCPSCSAPLMAGAVVCTFCGYDLRTGRKVLGPREPWWPKVSGLLGPLAALLLVAGAAYYVHGRWLAGEKGGGGKPPAAAPPAAPPPAAGTPGVVKPPAASFSGGPAPARMRLEDLSAPYRLEEDLVLGAGTELEIGPGVRLEGRAAVVGCGRLRLRGEAERPVCVAVPVRLAGEGGHRPSLRAVKTAFLQRVELRGPAEVRAEGCEFRGGLAVALEVLEAGRAEVELAGCRLAGPEPVLELAVPGHARQMVVKVTGCDIAGRLEGRIGSFSVLDLSGNYWSAGVKEALAALEGEGEVLTEPVSAEPVAGGLRLAATPAGPRLEAGRLSLPAPEGWKRAGEKTLWRQTPRGSLVVTLLEERLPAGGLEGFLEAELRRLRGAVDRGARRRPLEEPLAEGGGFRDHVVELRWFRRPYRVLYHLREGDRTLLGLRISAPAALWADERQELERLAAALRVKGG